MVGLIGTKVGMTQKFSDEGALMPVTILKIENNYVVNKRSLEKDGYNAVVVGAIDLKEKKVKKPYKGIFTGEITPKQELKEFRIEDPDKYEIGQEIGLDIFENIDYVDIIGSSKGKGFQGVVKRHGFGGGRKTHGSKFHRQNGSTGHSAYPSRVFKGLKRAGRMGNDKVTVQNLKVLERNNEDNILIVKGAVPGNKRGIVYIKKAVKK